MKKAVFDLGHAGCVSCKRAIEHAGRHIEGIEEIEVDLATHKINISYNEKNVNAKDELTKAVSRIGYEAKLVTDI